MALGEVLDRNRLKQKQIAEAIGVSEETVSRWVNGHVRPSGDNLVRLAAYLRRYQPDVREADLLAPADDAGGSLVAGEGQ